MPIPYQLYSNYLFAKAGGQGIPLSGTFELTARCNLDCRMCYIHKRANDAAVLRRERSAADWLALAQDCQKAGTLLLLLTGGEPFLRPDFREIYTGCRRLGLMVSINTNATLIDDDTIAFLAADPPARVNITLYGASPDTYGALCGDRTAYDRAVHAILGLKQAGVLVKLNFSVTPVNAADAAAVYAFAKEHDLPLQTATYMFPPVRGRAHDPGAVGRGTDRLRSSAVCAGRAARAVGEAACRRRGVRPGPRVSGTAERAHPLPRGQQHVLGDVGRADAAMRHDDHALGRPRYAGFRRRVAGHPRGARADFRAAAVQHVHGQKPLRPVRGDLLCGNRFVHRRTGVPVRADPRLSGGHSKRTGKNLKNPRGAQSNRFGCAFLWPAAANC